MQLTLRHHTAGDYDALPDMNDINAGVLSREDQVCLNELGRSLLNTKSNSRFGISLLHSHFPVSDTEVFVQTSDATERTVSLSPQRLEPTLQKSMAALNVRFEETQTSNAISLIGLEYFLKQSAPGIDSINSADANVLGSIHAVLDRHGKTARFGVRVIHMPVELAEDEVYSESCDIDRRVLICEVVNKRDPLLARSIETFWVWPDLCASADDPDIIAHCPAKCKITCLDGNFGHPRGHKDLHKTIDGDETSSASSS